MDSGNCVVSVFVDNRDDNVDLPSLSDYISGLYADRRIRPTALAEVDLLRDRTYPVANHSIPAIYELPFDLEYWVNV